MQIAFGRRVRSAGDAFRLVGGAKEPSVSEGVTQILVGEPLRSRWQELLRGSFVNRLIRKASNIDVHVIARRER